MARKDPYEVLGVPRDVDTEGLKKAYRKLARQLHPDVNPGDAAAEARFKEVSEAYAILSDPEKRRNYDEFGDASLEGGFDADTARRARDSFHQRFGGGGRRGPGGFEHVFTRGGPGAGEDIQFDGDLEDLIARMMGREHAGGPRRGSDLEAELELSLREAALGCEQRLTLGRPGAGSETITVKVPPGMVTGSRIRIAGKGAEGRDGGPPGDLFATIRVRPDPRFEVEGRDLYLDLPVTFSEATLGAAVEVPTLEGTATLTLPPGTDGGKRLRLRGKGIPGAGTSPAGDLYATVRIRVPRDLDDAARARVEALRDLDPPDPRKELES
jgi:curved DNA-binding protein